MYWLYGLFLTALILPKWSWFCMCVNIRISRLCSFIRIAFNTRSPLRFRMSKFQPPSRIPANLLKKSSEGPLELTLELDNWRIVSENPLERFRLIVYTKDVLWALLLFSLSLLHNQVLTSMGVFPWRFDPSGRVLTGLLYTRNSKQQARYIVSSI